MSTQVLSGIVTVDASCGGLYGDPADKTQTILLVEDEAFVREVTEEVLRIAGYRVLAVKNAADAVTIYEAYVDDIDLLLTDVVLPGESGSTLAERLRGENPRLPVLLVTGYGTQMERIEAKAEAWLAKPFSSEVLLKTLQRMLDSRSLNARLPDSKTVPARKVDELTRACDRA